MLQEYSYLYTIPYVVVFLFLCYFFYRERLGDINAKWKAFFLLLFFIGLRGFVASDYINYYPFFQNLPTILDLQFEGLYNGEFEFGFILYSSLIKTIFPNYFFWVFINALIDLSILFFMLRRHCVSPTLAFIVFFCIQGLGLEFNLFRNTKAIFLFVLSIPYLKERKIIPYFAMNLTGTLFHVTSFIYLPMYFVLDKRIPKLVVWSMFIFVNVAIFLDFSITEQIVNVIAPILGIERMSNKLANYFSGGEEYGLSIGYVERMFAFILFTLMSRKLVVKNEYNQIFYNCFFFYYIIFHLFFDIGILGDRFSCLFVFSYWFLYPNTLSVIYKIKNRQILLSFIILLCFMKIMSYSTYVMSMYDNVLFGIRSFEERSLILYQFMQ